MGLGVKTAFKQCHAQEIQMFSHALLTPLASFCALSGDRSSQKAISWDSAMGGLRRAISSDFLPAAAVRTDGWIARGSISRRSRSLGNYSLRRAHRGPSN
jgi:hypothetical protein